MNKTSFIISILLCCTLLYAPSHAFGGEEGLYPAAPPPGSAFVRFLNGSSAAPIAVTVKGKSYGSAALGRISAYAPVPQGDTNLSLGTQSAVPHLKEGAYYTALFSKGSLSVLEEPASDNKLKAQIVLINASSTPGITLKTADGATSVVDTLTAGKLAGRSVNAIKVPLSVYAAKNKIKDLDAHLLERGVRYAVVVYDGINGKPTVTFD